MRASPLALTAPRQVEVQGATTHSRAATGGVPATSAGQRQVGVAAFVRMRGATYQESATSHNRRHRGLRAVSSQYLCPGRLRCALAWGGPARCSVRPACRGGGGHHLAVLGCAVGQPVQAGIAQPGSTRPRVAARPGPGCRPLGRRCARPATSRSVRVVASGCRGPVPRPGAGRGPATGPPGRVHDRVR